LGFSKSNLINKLENVQLDVARIVTGGTKNMIVPKSIV
jgi:hypothetical protein